MGLLDGRRAAGCCHRHNPPYFLNVRRIFKDMAKDVTRFQAGSEVAPGITAVDAAGHTPGHTAFAVASGNDSLLVLSDTTNNPWLFVRHPEWQPVIDLDGPKAVETRKRLLDRAAADRMLVQGYHFPFPARGYITRTASGYDLMPAPCRLVRRTASVFHAGSCHEDTARLRVGI